MVSFRKSILALAVLALFVGVASAQVGTANGTGSYTGSLTCSATVANPNQLRAEGVTELIGDIVLTCTGATPNPGPGGLVPIANFTVSLGTNVTSRILGGASEALLMIDEPGSGLTGTGPALPQTICTTSNSAAPGAGPTGCIGSAAGAVGLYNNAGAASVCTTLSGTTCTAFGATPNVFMGVVSGNQVVFNGIPVLAPVTGGVTRVFRITNIRANAAGIGNLGLAGTTPLNASITISGASSVLVNNPVLVTGFIQNGLNASVRSASGGSFSGGPLSFLQCNSVNSGGSFASANELLRFQENFATAFKTRVAATATNNGLFTPGGAFQNVPGNVYYSESGFILPTGSGTAGLADFGTRLRAVFSNVPAGVSIWVSTSNVNGLTGTFGGNSGVGNTPLPNGGTSPLAFLVQTETAPDFSSQAPIVNPTNTLSGGFALAQIPVTNGTGEAVWEVVQANPAAPDTLDFQVYFQFSANPGSGSPALGSGKVNLSYAPAPGLPGTSTPSSWTQASSTLPIPRFVDNSTGITNITISTCSTDLLFPFVTNENGFETGISIANTTSDPFSTPAQNGSCYIQFYGDNAPSTNTATTAPCTSAGACTGAINSGKVFANTLSGILGTGSFQGYAIAVCNFQYAHGFAFISDTHATNLAMGYLAIVLNGGTQISNERGVPGEGLAH